MAPLELYQKVWVSTAFLETDHGRIGCVGCHGGNPKEPDWQTAHIGLIKDPTYPDAETACGECHSTIVSTAKNSLHYTLAPFKRVLSKRAGKNKGQVLKTINHAREKHCTGCHASCGQCHVSRPDYAQGGFLNKHLFQKKPPMDVTCASCHGGRVYEEFTGAKGLNPADVHFEKAKMDCTGCHTADEIHADAGRIDNRFNLSQRPDCLNCHGEILAEKTGTKAHQLHNNKVACQVCHAQAYKNCFSCHVGTDSQGLPYFQCKETRILFKIGKNRAKTQDRPFNYVVLRHPPANRALFDFYIKGGLTAFDALPTWKLASPHTIQRKTPQNSQCNNCHGNASLFLTKSDLAQGEEKANAGVMVSRSSIPEPILNNKPEQD